MAAPQIYRAALECFLLPTGLSGITARVKLLLRNRWHQYEEVRFQADSGTNITTISLSVAQRHEFPYSPNVVVTAVRTSGGVIQMPVHAGQIVVRIPGWKPRDFIWPCHFVEYPAEQPLLLLGLSGVINDVFLYFDSTYALEAPYGWVVLQERLADRGGPAPSAIPV